MIYHQLLLSQTPRVPFIPMPNDPAPHKGPRHPLLCMLTRPAQAEARSQKARRAIPCQARTTTHGSRFRSRCSMHLATQDFDADSQTANTHQHSSSLITQWSKTARTGRRYRGRQREREGGERRESVGRESETYLFLDIIDDEQRGRFFKIGRFLLILLRETHEGR